MNSVENHYFLVVPVAVIIAAVLYLFLRRKVRFQKLKVTLAEKVKLTHDTYIFTFVLPPGKKRLGLQVGEHIQIETIINSEPVLRKYTPISRINKVGSFDLLVKIYHKCERFPEGGKMTQWLETLNEGDLVNISCPFGRFNYKAKGMTEIKDFDNKIRKERYDNLYMVAGGTGITPIYQIIQYISEMETVEDRPKLTLLFANRSEDDILLEKELKEYEESNKTFKCYFSVDKAVTDNWQGFQGFIDQQKIKKSVPQDLSKMLFLSCGPPILSNIVEKIWKKSFDIPNERIFRF